MSTVTRPRGPLPARVYWTRRLVLLTLVLLIGWLLLRWVDGGGGESGAAQSGDETPAAATETDENDDAGETTNQEPRGGDRERTARIRTVAESFERPRENCDLTEVRVEPSVADPVYSGEPAQVTLRISSSSSAACSLGIDADHLLVSISSGRDVVWDSTKCDDAILARELALQPRWSSLVDVTWSGRHSGRNCAPDASIAEPGTYTVEAAVLEGEPSADDFEVVERPEPPAGEDEADADADAETDKGDSGDDADDKGSDGDKSGDQADDENASDDKGRDDTDRR